MSGGPLQGVRVGEHTREILREAGYGEAAIEALIASGVAGAWKSGFSSN